MKKLFGLVSLVVCVALVFGVFTACCKDAAKTCSKELIALNTVFIADLTELTAKFEAVEDADELEELSNRLVSLREENQEASLNLFEKHNVAPEQLLVFEALIASETEASEVYEVATAALYAAAARLEAN